MNHSFDIDIAKEYGLNEAIILNNIFFWCEQLLTLVWESGIIQSQVEPNQTCD